jgi:caa(3)-type oxidase subunit IV
MASESHTTHGHGAPASHGHGDGHGQHESHAHLNPAHYTKILWMLMVLAVVSYLGPMGAEFIAKTGATGLAKALTLSTAFGIAFYKAYLVCVNFMHLHIEKRYVVFLLSTAIAFMLLFFAGASPDVRNHRGRNWENVAAQQETARALAAHGSGGHADH